MENDESSQTVPVNDGTKEMKRTSFHPALKLFLTDVSCHKSGVSAFSFASILRMMTAYSKVRNACA